jgi:hypothetical protein
MFQSYIAANVFMLQVVSVGSCICCNGYAHMLQVYVSDVSAVFISMLQVFYLDVAFCSSGYTHMLQAYVSKCFICFRCML